MEKPDIAELERGRECYCRREWSAAFEALAAADRTIGLGAEDLERLAMAAYLIGRDEDYLSALGRAHHAHLEAGERLRGVRCAFWLGLRLLFRGETGRATGWLARAERLIECEGRECVERGYLLLPVVQQHLNAKDWERAYSTATTAAEIAELYREADLLACARQLQGCALIQHGESARGLALLDEAMVTVAADNLSPLVTGVVYCSVIEACQEIYAVGRAREWTLALGARGGAPCA